jgi:predicted nuclease with TOPRIM domain
MIEDISQVYEYVDIRAWAEQIREMKINELKESVSIYEEIIEKEAEKYADSERYKKIVNHEIDILKQKLDYLILST